MSLTWFYIIITVAVVGLIVMVFSEYPMLRRAKAGKADKYVFGHTFARRLSQISVGESCVALADYEQMVAAGDSMKDYNIHNGDIILVSRYDETARKNIDHYPAIFDMVRYDDVKFLYSIFLYNQIQQLNFPVKN